MRFLALPVLLLFLFAPSPAAAGDGGAGGDAGGARAADARADRGPAESRVLYFQARVAQDSGDYESALYFLHRALKREPRNALFRHELGSLYRQLQAGRRARRQLRAAVRLAPDNPEYRFTLGQAWLDAGRPAFAQRHFEPLAAAGDEQALAGLADIYTSRGLERQARETYRQLLARRPDYHEARLNYAILLEEARRPEEALAQLARVRAADPENRAAALLEARLHRQAGALDRAAALYGQLAADRPDHHAARISLALVRLEQDDREGAVNALAPLFDDLRHAEMLRTAGAIYQLAGRDGPAAVLLARSLEIEDDPATRFALAAALDRDGQAAAAREQLHRVIADDPGHHAALNYLGYSLLVTGGDRETAATLIRRAVRLAPDNGAYLDSLGWYYFLDGNRRFARYYLYKAARLAAHPETFAHLAALYRADGDHRRCAHYRRRALEAAGGRQP